MLLQSCTRTVLLLDIAINVVRCVSDLNVVFSAQGKQDAKASTTNKSEFGAVSINTPAKQA